MLANVENINPQCWMKALGDFAPLSALSIPGTHNSPTCYRALPTVRCQAVSVIDQLRNGIRFLDIRVQPDQPDDPSNVSLSLVHGAFSIFLCGSRKFRGLLDEVHAFLRENPSETVIMSLKREGTGHSSDQQLSLILYNHYILPESEYWYTKPRIPELGEVRGKIVLMRRFALADELKPAWQGRGLGLNAERWAYNTDNCRYGDVCVQDFCEVMEPEVIDKKFQFCCDHLERAAAVVCPIPDPITAYRNTSSAGPLYLNFLSGANLWNYSCWPERITTKLNPAVASFLHQTYDVGDCGGEQAGREPRSGGCVGVIVCDWVGKNGDWDLVQCIISLNNRLPLQNGRE